jgi:ribosomal-protein-alanine N-acetyltransferase
MRTLSAPPLVLEPLAAGHAHEMFAVLGDPAIYEFENSPPVSEEALLDRYTILERRKSPSRTQDWLNWVIRLPTKELAGYVQATVLPTGDAYVAYELASRFWRQGIGSTALAAVLDELRVAYGVRLYVAVLKIRNFRSEGMLRKLGFEPASAEQFSRFSGDVDEMVMVKIPGEVQRAG